MFHLTKQEQMILYVLLVVLFTGSSLSYAFKKYPQLSDVVNLTDSHVIYPKTDINSASIEELVDIPYIGQYTAQNVVNYRQKYGPFTSLEQLKQVKGIRDKNYEKFRKYLRID